ncbi:class III lanthionine synthetase LanKC, partial [Staphylococcus simulans]|uniref:class III lanthionine synthetase LanKC n=1 Tax=Staphylococcus simulans TaxID=1286 RepID=UPI000D1FB4E2
TSKNPIYELENVPNNFIMNTSSESVWTFYYTKDEKIPLQGWKIHISASLKDSELILKNVADICFDQNIPFKHLKDFESYMKLNSKNAHRSASGKFVTIYPSNESIFLELLNTLRDALMRFDKGPYILSDKRWKDSNVFYRYGAFQSMFDEEGNLSIYNTEGKMIPDNRTPFYNPPEFVKSFDEYLDTINSNDSYADNNLNKYNIQTPFTFSNAGGVYLAERKSDLKKVVIKEARPQSGLDGALKDALHRQKKEYDALKKLKDVSGVVNLVDYFKEWEHYFLVEDYIEGIDLKKWVLINYPFYKDKSNINSYAEKIIRIASQIIDIIGSIHDRNVSMVDMQPANLLIDDELNVTLIDFETATSVESTEVPSLKTIGFISDELKVNGARDWYGAKKIIKYMCLPVLNSEMLESELSSNHIKWIKDNYGDKFLEFFISIQKHCDRKIEKYEAISFESEYSIKDSINDLNTIKSKLLSGLIDNLDDNGQLINGDIRQFELKNGKFNFLNGGVGATYTLLQNNINTTLSNKWINDVSLKFIEISDDWGLLTGKCGAMSAIYEAGHKSFVKNKLEELYSNIPDSNIYLRSGLSGIGLFLISFYLESGESKCLEAIKKIADLIDGKIKDGRLYIGTEDWMAVNRGLIDGMSGVSLFYSLLYYIVPENKYINMAKKLIDKELKNSEEEFGTLHLKDDRNRLLPYISGGSIGLAIAIHI